MKKRALIVGINGMDGSHLADFLISKNYEVFGIERKKENRSRKNLKHILDKITILNGNLSNKNSLIECVEISNPDEIYNLAGYSTVEDGWNDPEKFVDINSTGVLRILEIIKEIGTDKIKFFQASSAEMFGKMFGKFLDEESNFYPKSHYGIAKLYSHLMCKSYRKNNGLFCCCGILFNHESERRDVRFVTRKITHSVAKIHLGLSDYIELGNLNSSRDWGYSPDYVEGMWLMLQQNYPDDYVLSTGILHSISDILNIAFSEIGVINWKKYIKKDNNFYRPVEVDVLLGNSNKALEKLKWKPKTTFADMIKIMLKNDINLLKN